MELATKRVYEQPAPDDGARILIDRLWPRGLSRETAGIDLWLREIAPSAELRRWFAHDPDKWEEFRTRYFAELDANPEAVETVLIRARAGKVTLLFGSREERWNNAAALREYLERSEAD